MNIESLSKWFRPRDWVAQLAQMDWRAWIGWVQSAKWLKWRVMRWVLLVPVVLIAILVALPFLIPVSVYKDKIIEQVRLATGRDLTIGGDLRLSFWPAFGVRVEKVGFANAPGAADAQMATMDEMIVGAQLLPLLSGSLSVSEVRFVKPVIHLEVDKQGRGNWLLEGQGAPGTQATPGGSSKTGGDVSFADVRIVDGTLTYRDQRTGTNQRIDAINAVVRLPSLDQPMTIDGGLTWNKEAIDIETKIANLRALSSGSKSALSAHVHGEVVDVSFDGGFDPQGNAIDGKVDMSAQSIKRLAAWAGVDASSADRLGEIKLAGLVTAQGETVTLKDVKFSAGGDALQAAFTGTIDGAHNTISGFVDAHTASARELAKRAGVALPGTKGFGAATVRGPVSISADRIQLTQTKFAVDGDLLAGTFSGVVDPTKGAINGTADLHSRSARQLAGNAGIALAGTRGFGPMTLEGGIGTSAGRITLKDAKLSIDGDLLRATFTGSLDATASRISGAVDLHSSSARELAAQAGFALPGKDGFGALAISGSLNSTAQQIAFEDAKIALDGMHGSGDLTLTVGARPYAKGQLSLDRLDLNQYTGGGEAHGQSGGAIPAWTDDTIDFSPLRTVDADLGFSVNALNAGGLRIGRSVLALVLNGGKLKATLKEMALYSGNGSGTVTLNGASGVPEVQMDLGLTSVKVEPLLTDAAGVNRLSGEGNVALKLTSAGRSQRALMSALNGTVQVNLADGAIKGANLAEIARTIQSVLSGTAIGGPAKTDFAELSASLQIVNGVGHNEDLRLLNPYVRLSGAGTVDVANQRLDYRVEPRAVRSIEGQGGKDLRGVGIPFKIKGPWSKLSYSPDLSGVVNSTIDTIIQGGDPLENLKNQTGLDQIFGKKKPKTPSPGEQPQSQPQTPPAQPAPDAQPATPPADQQQPPPQDPAAKTDPLDALKQLLKPH